MGLVGHVLVLDIAQFPAVLRSCLNLPSVVCFVWFGVFFACSYLKILKCFFLFLGEHSRSLTIENKLLAVLWNAMQ